MVPSSSTSARDGIDDPPRPTDKRCGTGSIELKRHLRYLAQDLHVARCTDADLHFVVAHDATKIVRPARYREQELGIAITNST